MCPESMPSYVVGSGPHVCERVSTLTDAYEVSPTKALLQVGVGIALVECLAALEDLVGMEGAEFIHAGTIE